MEEYSHPLNITHTVFTTVYHLKTRANPAKPGRTMTILYDSLHPLVEGFSLTYQYHVVIDAGMYAGGHYHAHKYELYYLLSGDLTILIEDPQTKERETIIMQPMQIISIRPGLAHRVSSVHGGQLLVMASDNVHGDEVTYQFGS